ncbi:MAG: guanylate kinase [Chitinivibrionales bacterium]|nr:guanylate kinase [Chitinivibrionales bacterium]MBD3397197.1 guanylate kinase [Chitinivibrionales bacterium]
MSTPPRGKIIVCSAPSGAGKTTLLEHVRQTVPNLVYSISATTRPPRRNERDGADYFFMSVGEFKRRIDAGEFAEWQIVHGSYYGTPRSFVDKTVASGKHLVMDIDVRGKVMFDESYPGAHGILILPPSHEVLEKRLRGRGTDTEETISTRLENARKEIEFAETRGRYEYRIVNDDLEGARKRIVEVVREIIGEGGG